MLYDVFISHASEDKTTFVRHLADALQAKNVTVWYDEFSLKAGDSLRRSIDLGLSKSRFGIVVLSKAFFLKPWPQWELDGLVQRQMDSRSPLILPIWLDVTHDDVFKFSPTLADRYAIVAKQDINAVVDELLKVINPQGSSLVVARDRLIEAGIEPPVVTDDWWHQAIEYCGSNPEEGTFQEAMGWGRWGFPLPQSGRTAAQKGKRIARAAMQLNWQKRAEEERISQITHPNEVHDFINTTPGLKSVCHEHPHYLAAYAPQLTIPGLGGDFETIFDNWLAQSRKQQENIRKKGSRSGIALTTNGNVPSCDESIALHDPEFGHYEASHIACNFVQGYAVASGPPVKVYENIDYIAWFLSEKSSWLPEKWRSYLTKGMKDWSVWQWGNLRNDPEFTPNESTGSLLGAMYECNNLQTFRLKVEAERDLYSRIEFAKSILQLPESALELVERFKQKGFIEAWIQDHSKR